MRFSAGVTFSDNDLGINRILIPEGSYARFHYYGKPNNLGFAFQLFDHFPSSFGTHDVLIHVPLI